MKYTCASLGLWLGDEPDPTGNCSLWVKVSTNQIYKLVNDSWVEIVPVGISDTVKLGDGRALVIENGLITELIA